MLRPVDPVQPYVVLHVVGIEHARRVAIGDAHDLAGQRLGGDGGNRCENDIGGEQSYG